MSRRPRESSSTCRDKSGELAELELRMDSSTPRSTSTDGCATRRRSRSSSEPESTPRGTCHRRPGTRARCAPEPTSMTTTTSRALILSRPGTRARPRLARATSPRRSRTPPSSDGTSRPSSRSGDRRVPGTLKRPPICCRNPPSSMTTTTRSKDANATEPSAWIHRRVRRLRRQTRRSSSIPSSPSRRSRSGTCPTVPLLSSSRTR